MNPALALLRGRLERLEKAAPQPITLPFGDPRLDGHLPAGGLPLGRLHEIGAQGLDAETGAAGAAFAACLLARLSGPIVWSFQRPDLHGPGLSTFGLHPDRLILVHARSEAEVLAVVEESLRTPQLAAALGEVGRLDLTASRRLQLACEQSGATAFVLRRWPYGRRGAPLRQEPSAAVTRWDVTPMPSGENKPGLGAARFKIALLYCRGGRTGNWIMELSDASPGHVRVVTELADCTAEAPQASARAAG